MNIIIYVTEVSSVNFSIKLMEEFEENYSVDNFLFFVYRNEIKLKILEKVNSSKVVIITQSYINQNTKENSINANRINEIENKYTRDSIWDYVYQDRMLLYTRSGFLYKKKTSFNREQLLSKVINRFDVLENLIDDFNPDFAVYCTQDFGTSISTLLFEILNFRKKPIHIPIIAKFGNFFSLTNDIYGSWEFLEKSFKFNINNKEFSVEKTTKDLLVNYKQGNKTAFYITKTNKTPLLLKFIKKIKTIYKYIFKELRNKSDYLHIPLHKYAFDNILISLRKLIMSKKNFFVNYNEIENSKYIFFPLHLEPELVLLVQSQPFIDQLNVIRNISKNLPRNIQLVVKDHPVADGRREISFFKELVQIPNVKILNSKINSIEIIKKSLGVITIIGSAGQEAFLHDKPVITLSNPFFNFLPSVNKIFNYDEIPHIVSKWDSFKPNMREQEVFLQTLINNSIDINLLGLIKDLSLKYKPKNVDNQNRLFMNFLISKINKDFRK